MTDDVPARILQEASEKCERAEVYSQEGETCSVRFERNSLKRITTRQFRGVGLRVFHNGRIGFASSTDLREPGRLVELACEAAEFGEKANFEFPERPDELPEVATNDESLDDVSAADMVDIMREGLEMSVSADADYMFDGKISRTTHVRRILNSRGLDQSYRQTGMNGMVSIEHISDSGMLSVGERKSWGQPFDSVTDITSTALDKMKQGSTITPARTDTLPVVFTPKAVGVVFSPVLMAVSGKLVYKGSSVLQGKVGEQVLDSRLSITDDPTVDYGVGSGPIDDEGVPVKQFPIIEDGVLKGYMFDLHTAAYLDTQSTGHGYRSYSSQPSPSGTNTLVAAGEDDVDEMITDLDRAVIVDEVLGAGQSNTLAGEFSVNVSLGFLVEDGKIQGRVKDCMVAGNSYEVLSEVRSVSNQREWVGSNLFPTICVGELKLASQGG